MRGKAPFDSDNQWGLKKSTSAIEWPLIGAPNCKVSESPALLP